jgi:hypothetical protein
MARDVAKNTGAIRAYAGFPGQSGFGSLAQTQPGWDTFKPKPGPVPYLGQSRGTRSSILK